MLFISFRTQLILFLLAAGVIAVSHGVLKIKNKIEFKKYVKEYKKNEAMKKRHKEARDNVVYEYEY